MHASLGPVVKGAQMKLLITSLSIAVASSSVATAAPNQAKPVAAEARTDAPAPSAERVLLARKFIALTDPADAIVEMFRIGFWQGVSNSIEDEAVLTEAKAGLDSYLGRLEPKVREKMSRLVEAYAQVYAREFSAEELQQMIAFAESPTGRHYLDGYAKLESDEQVVDAMSELMEGLTPALQDIQKEMCAEKAAQRIAMGDTKAKCPLAAAAETQAG
jgi:hypothetical protein